MLLFLLYIAIAVIVGRFAWCYSVAKWSYRDVAGLQPVYIFGAAFWIIATPAVIVIALLWHPVIAAGRLGTKLGARAAAKAKR
jgi:hypothetical protein